MKIILKQDVDNLGFKDQVVSVKNGYGRNYLIPTGRATLATPPSIRALNERLKQQTYKEKKVIEEAKKTAVRLAKLNLKISSRTSEADKLFGSVSAVIVAEALNKKGFNIDRKYISLPGKVIKRLGSYVAAIYLHREVPAKLSFEIVAENNKQSKD